MPPVRVRVWVRVRVVGGGHFPRGQLPSSAVCVI